MDSHLRYCLSVVALTILYLSSTSSAKNLPANFVFGDSLVDAGNNDYLTSLSKANFLPFGIDFPTHKPTGRFTNGRTIVDIIGQALGLENFTPPYLAPTTTGDVILQGVNYASGGGGILTNTGLIFLERLSLDQQIEYYSNTRNEIISMIGKDEAENLLRKALFSITIGSNDFINNYLVPVLSVPEREEVSPEQFVEEMIAKFREQLTKLYTLDARKILVVNVGPIGCIPYQREINLEAGSGCVELPNHLAQLYNKRLWDLTVELKSSLHGSLFVYGNVYNIVTDIIQNYKNYGFKVAESACCFLKGRYGGLIPCSPVSEVCRNRSDHVFWDPYHPSDAANVIIAGRLVDGNLSDIFPMNVRQWLDA